MNNGDFHLFHYMHCNACIPVKHACIFLIEAPSSQKNNFYFDSIERQVNSGITFYWCLGKLENRLYNAACSRGSTYN